jgi:hypothetical protein
VTNAQIETITRDRLTRWGYRVLDDHATPLVLVGIGHDAAAGRVSVYTVDEPEMTDAAIAAFLRKAAIMLDPDQRRAVP